MMEPDCCCTDDGTGFHRVHPEGERSNNDNGDPQTPFRAPLEKPGVSGGSAETSPLDQCAAAGMGAGQSAEPSGGVAVSGGHRGRQGKKKIGQMAESLS